MKFPTEDTPPRNNLYLQSVTLEDIATIYLYSIPLTSNQLNWNLIFFPKTNNTSLDCPLEKERS